MLSLGFIISLKGLLNNHGDHNYMQMIKAILSFAL